MNRVDATLLKSLQKCSVSRRFSGVGLVLLLMLGAERAAGGGGMVIEGDRCIVEIEFYSAHFTA